MKELKWYELTQNNSGGYFDVDDKLCHKLYIQAETEADAILKAEYLGCYWNGVEMGMDCECCGDRWYPGARTVNLEKYVTDGYPVSAYGNDEGAIKYFNSKYGKYEFLKEPAFEKVLYYMRYAGKIKLNGIEEYAQFMADEYGWTAPDGRIYYDDGTVKEIFKS